MRKRRKASSLICRTRSALEAHDRCNGAQGECFTSMESEEQTDHLLLNGR